VSSAADEGGTGGSEADALPLSPSGGDEGPPRVNVRFHGDVKDTDDGGSDWGHLYVYESLIRELKGRGLFPSGPLGDSVSSSTVDAAMAQLRRSLISQYQANQQPSKANAPSPKAALTHAIAEALSPSTSPHTQLSSGGSPDTVRGSRTVSPHSPLPNQLSSPNLSHMQHAASASTDGSKDDGGSPRTTHTATTNAPTVGGSSEAGSVSSGEATGNKGGVKVVERKEDAAETRKRLWGEPWGERVARMRRNSPYGTLKSWRLQSVIVKGGDDLRQELLACQLISQFKHIFDEARLPLWLRPYDILPTSSTSGIIEYIADTSSVDTLKKNFETDSLARVFEKAFGDNLYQAKKNFIESHAAYSLVSYFLNVKDRHNANLLLDSEGHLIHIDFGYMLSNSPGNVNFEGAPFKLTREYLEVMDNECSDNYEYFRTLIIRGFLEVRKHSDRLLLLVQMMLSATRMPCLSAGGAEWTFNSMKDRFLLSLTEDQCIEKIVDLIDTSVNNWRSVQYDKFQWWTNGIL